ncbi:MAG: ABC transporter ATP-binding protein [Nitrospirae bacterium]|nr:ABC transporter ATP-binding protein [Nitrospirota bacterium]MCL5977264.1 ABC transporter ATP-binding protein [Nitrospirota bacterium]
MSFIRCECVWKIYNEAKPYEVRALEDVSLNIEKDSFVIFTGPSGSGKTTLISIIGCIDRQTRGRVYIDGKDLTDLSDIALSSLRQKRTGFVFQNFNLIQGLPAWENVSMPLIPMGIKENNRKHTAIHLLKRVGLSERHEHSPEEMSGGEQQRVAIARALVNNPDIIILDEPTSNIDVDAVGLLIDILSDLKREGKTILMASHDENMLKNADIIHELKRGRLVK